MYIVRLSFLCGGIKLFKMANYCKKCGDQTMLMSGYITLEPDREPYESGKEESPRTDVDTIEKHIIAHYCENCDEVMETFNE